MYHEIQCKRTKTKKKGKWKKIGQTYILQLSLYWCNWLDETSVHHSTVVVVFVLFVVVIFCLSVFVYRLMSLPTQAIRLKIYGSDCSEAWAKKQLNKERTFEQKSSLYFLCVLSILKMPVSYIHVFYFFWLQFNPLFFQGIMSSGGVEEFECPDCFKVYSSRRTLLRHTRTVHGIDGTVDGLRSGAFACPDEKCKVVPFRRANDLVSHCQKEHPGLLGKLLTGVNMS